MNRVLWDTIFLITGSLFTFGAGQGNLTIATTALITTNTTQVGNSTIATTALITTRTTHVGNSTIASRFLITTNNTTHAPNISTSTSTAPATTTTSNDPDSSTTTITATSTSTVKIPPVKKLVAAAVRSHFDDCPDSHSHFCFHGTCRFLILEETPACICHPGFVGMRCEHADLLAVVATNHREQTVATALVLCVIGCVMTMLFCTLVHCWWRRDCRRRSHAHHYASEKPGSMLKGGASFCRPENVV